MLHFEHKRSPVATRARFFKRLLASILFGAGIVVVSLAVGIAGYHYLEHLAWLDAFVNAAMILSSMGPLAAPQSTAGKLFAGTYALYSGLVLIVIAGIVFAPVFHRFLHKFHVEDDAADQAGDERVARNSGSRTRDRAVRGKTGGGKNRRPGDQNLSE